MTIAFIELGVLHGKCESVGRIETVARAMDITAKTLTESGKKLESMTEKPTDSGRIGQKVEIPTEKKILPEKRQAIIISPINPDGKTKIDTKRIITERFKPSDLGVRPERLLNNGKAGMKIETEEIEMGKINKEKLNRAGLKIEIQG